MCFGHQHHQGHFLGKGRFFFLFVVSWLSCARHGPYGSNERYIQRSAAVSKLDVPDRMGFRFFVAFRPKAEKWPAATVKVQESPSVGGGRWRRGAQSGVVPRHSWNREALEAARARATSVTNAVVDGASGPCTCHFFSELANRPRVTRSVPSMLRTAFRSVLRVALKEIAGGC